MGIEKLGVVGKEIDFAAVAGGLWTGKICVFIWQRIGPFAESFYEFFSVSRKDPTVHDFIVLIFILYFYPVLSF